MRPTRRTASTHALVLLVLLASCSDIPSQHVDLPAASSGGAGAGGGPEAGGALAVSAGGTPGSGGAASGGAPITAAGGTTSAGGAASDADAGAPDSALGDPVPTPLGSGCVTDVTAGDRTVACNGLTYDVAIPEACLTRSCGLIFDVHGGTMSGPMEDKNTHLAALGKAHGFIVVHPNANGGLWNYATDDSKVFDFMSQLHNVFHTDPARLHMTGLSQGGYMSWRFLCQHTDVLASVAPAAAAGAANISAEVGCTFTGTDVPKGEIDVLYMHGTQDGLVNFQNAITLRDAIIAYWKTDAGTVVASDGTYERTRYTEPNGHVFEFIKHDYTSPSTFGLPPLLGVAIKGHCFPGSEDQTVTLPGQLMSFGCTPPTSFTWGEEVLKFFLAHPKH